MSDKVQRIVYMTDIEGNLDYFSRLMDIQARATKPCLKWRDSDRTQLDFHSDDAGFVFGGDLFDKGPGDIRLSGLFLDLKQRYPDRVHLLIGNRDVNKLKLLSELDESDLARPVEDIPPPFWVRKDSQISLKQYLADKPNNQQSRLNYLLETQFNCPKTFEYRREELRLLGRDASDKAVTESFVQGAHKGGFYYEYISQAQLGLVWHNTLFVHGAVVPEAMRFVPDLDTACDDSPCSGTYVQEGGVQEWIRQLNAFKDMSLIHAPPLWDDNRTVRAGDALLAYAHRKAVGGRTIMVTSWLENDASIRNIPKEVVSYLTGSGIRRVLSGHKPVGDSPVIVASDGLEILMVDTSFSDTTAPDSRGQAASVVFLDKDEANGSTQATVHGVLRDGRAIVATLPAQPLNPSAAPVPPTIVGTELPHNPGWWVKAKLEQHRPDTYVTVNLQGFKVSYEDWQPSHPVGM